MELIGIDSKRENGEMVSWEKLGGRREALWKRRGRGL
jgi:hypothetical protein